MKQTKQLNQFRITLSYPELLVKSINILKEFVSEARIKITKNELRIIEMDNANVGMVVYRLLSSACTEYDVKNEFDISLSLDNLYTILKNAKKEDIVILENGDDEFKVNVWLKARSSRKYTIPLFNNDNKEQKIPDLKFTAKVTMLSSQFSQEVKEASNIAETLKFDVKPDSFTISAEGDLNKLEIPHRKDDDTRINADKEIISKYSVKYLEMMTSCDKIADDVILEFGNNYPIKMSYRLVDRLSFEWILAPKTDE